MKWSAHRHPFNKAQALPGYSRVSAEIVLLSEADMITTLQERLRGKSPLISFQAVRAPAETRLFCSAPQHLEIDVIPYVSSVAEWTEGPESQRPELENIEQVTR